MFEKEMWDQCKYRVFRHEKYLLFLFLKTEKGGKGKRVRSLARLPNESSPSIFLYNLIMPFG